MPKQLFALLLCVLLLAPRPSAAQTPASAQVSAYRPVAPAGGLWGPYRFREEPPVYLGNSPRLESLLREGKVYLSLQDAIALALENNLDIELQRYGPRLAEADLLRARAGSSIRGISTSVAGQTSGAAAVGALTTGAGSAIPSLDPTVNFNYNWAHQTTPQSSSFTTGTTSLVNTVTTANTALQKSFLTGTDLNFGWNNTLARSNSGRSDINPYSSVNLTLSIRQRLLQGFGVALNSRNIRIAKNNRTLSDLIFQQQVIATVSSVAGLYWDLVSYNEDVKVRQQALRLAEKLYSDNKRQVEVGTLAPIEVVRAEAEIARSEQDLTIAETRVLQQETLLKNALSRTGVASPSLAEARIVPTDPISMPPTDPIEPVQDLIATALAKRPEMQQGRIQIDNSKIGLAGAKSALRPTLDLVASFQNSGLAGQVNELPIPPVPGSGAQPTPRNLANIDPYFLGGYGSALAQALRRNFPNYAVGFQFNVPLRNRTAQADMIRDQVALRQQEIRQQQLINQVRLDVTNALIAVQQARATYQAAVKARILQEQTLEAEEKKAAVGASTMYFVIQYQRDLAQARSAEVAALSSYTKARVNLDVATGRTLETYNIQVAEALSGQISQAPASPPPSTP